MEKKYTPLNPLLLFLCFFSAAALAGCSLTSATAIQYSSPDSPEKNCTLNIASTFTIKKFDGQDVTWKPDFGDLWAQVQIPEGSHTFVFDYEQSAGSGTLSSYKAGNLSVTYDRFVAGHFYLFAAQPIPMGTRNLAIRVGIKDVTNEPDWGSFSKAFSWADGFEWLPVTRQKEGDAM